MEQRKASSPNHPLTGDESYAELRDALAGRDGENMHLAEALDETEREVRRLNGLPTLPTYLPGAEVTATKNPVDALIGNELAEQFGGWWT
jgi:hypothetical protein